METQKLSWKEQQRALSAKTRIVRIHTGERTAGKKMQFSDGRVHEARADGSVRRIK